MTEQRATTRRSLVSTARFQLFSGPDFVERSAPESAGAEFYVLLQRMRAAAERGEPAWAQHAEVRDYARICFWTIRKLEYSFGAEAVAGSEHGSPLSVLDIGCGIVPFCNWMSSRGHKVVAVDPSDTDIRLLIDNDVNSFYGSRVEYRSARGEDLPFQDETFDVVTCMSVLEHIPPGNDRLTLLEAARVLKPGGKLILTFDVAPLPPLQDGEQPWPTYLRRYAQPFSPDAARRLIRQIEPYFEVAAENLPSEMDHLTWDQVHRFWEVSRESDERTEPVREYLAMGGVLTRSHGPVELDRRTIADAYAEGQAALADRLRFFESHAQRRLHVISEVTDHASRLRSETEQKQQVIVDLETAASDRLHLIEHLDDKSRELREALQEKERVIAAMRALSAPPVEDLAVRLASIETSLAHQLAELSRLANGVSDASSLLMDARREVGAAVEDRLRILQREMEAAQAAADARLTIITQQQQQLEHYRRWRPFELLSRFVAPRIGQLYHHAPRPLRVPPSYAQTPTPSPAPSISIVTPSLNQGLFIERTIRSVLTQDYPNLEYVVKDAGSTDGTMQVLERYRDQLSHVESAPDTGFANGINVGFMHASGEIMAYLNSDDILLPGTLNYVAQFFVDHPDIEVVYGHRIIIDEYDSEVGRWVLPRHDDDVLSWADYVPQETLFWRRRIWEKTGGAIDETLRFAIDWDLLVRFRDAGARMHRLPRFLGAFRLHPHQKTSAELHSLGMCEMESIRERCNGEPVNALQVQRALRPYLRRHFVYHKLYKLGILRY